MNKLSFTALLLSAFITTGLNTQAKDKKEKKEEPASFITPVIDLKTTPVKDQQSTGTCWSFATTSFVETELLRMGKPEIDLSEMYFVRQAYEQKAQKYLRYQGLGNFSQGGQAHDVINVIRNSGFVTETDYPGKQYDMDVHHHYEMEAVLKGILTNSMEGKRYYTGTAMKVVNATLDVYMGKNPEKSEVSGKTTAPKDAPSALGFNPDDYVEITSYTCYPQYTKVDLEVPDNWSHGLYYNVPLNDLMTIINHALETGYSVCWDGDVSEKGFSHKNSVAAVPLKKTTDMTESEQSKWENVSEEDLYSFTKPIPEMTITDESRQKAFDLYRSTDDHLMHLTGTGKDEKGTVYYKTKNSWNSNSNKTGGYLYMSESYIKLNTVAIMIHKDALPAQIKSKLNIK